LCWGEEGFEDVWEEEGGGVLGGGGGDVAVEDGDWGWDCCCWALLIVNIVSIGFNVEKFRGVLEGQREWSGVK
jgi:hypothetical protein